MFILPKQSRFPEGYILYSFPSCVKPAHLFDLNNVKNPACAPVWKQRHVIQLMIQKTAYVLTPSSFITDVLSHMQQVVIIFLLYDTAGPTVQLCFTQFVVVVSRNVWPYRAGGFFFFGRSKELQSPVCADTEPLIPRLRLVPRFCLQCLFDVTLAERDRHHWVVGVLFCCVPFTPAVERTESNTTRVGHCLPVELITLMAPP